MGDLYIRMTEGNDIVQFSRTNTPNVFRTRLNSLFLDLGATTKIVVYGRGGNDYIQMTTATLAGGLPLKAEFYGEAGHDYLAGYTGDDLLVGGLGDDRLLAGDGNNELWGDDLGQQDIAAVGDGKDQLSAGSGIDRAYGGGGDDIITLGGGNDYAFGGWGHDSINGLGGHDSLYGGEGDDVLTGHDGNDVLAGGNGNDRLYGKTGDDLLIGGLGADQLNGEEGNDLLFHAGVTYNGQTENSTSAGDLADAAMLALLNDWIASAINGSLLPGGDPGDLANIDHLSGGAGTDRAYRRQNDPNKDTILEVESDLDAP
jgi:fibronectin-binding autotransporter adhesin